MSDRDLFNRTAEDAILSILIREPSSFYNITDKITEKMFSSKINEKIYAGLVSLIIERNTVPSVDLIMDHLEDIYNDPDVYGGANHIFALAGMTQNPDELLHYVKKLTDSYKARTLLQIGVTIMVLLKRFLHW